MIAPDASGIRAHMRHVRSAGLCASGLPVGGLRGWFAAHDRAVFVQFRREGLPVEWLESLRDRFADQVAAAARREAEARDGR